MMCARVCTPLSLYVGMLIKKFKLSNLAAIMILLSADLGIGFFTLPQYFSVDTLWGKYCAR